MLAGNGEPAEMTILGMSEHYLNGGLFSQQISGKTECWGYQLESEENEVAVIKDEEDDGLDKFYIFCGENEEEMEDFRDIWEIKPPGFSDNIYQYIGIKSGVTHEKEQ